MANPATNDVNRDSGPESAGAGSLHRMVRRFARRPGAGWKHMAGSVWEHTTGLRIHLLGMARLPDGKSVPWKFEDEYDAKRQQGYNTKRALMVWALSLLAPNRKAHARCPAMSMERTVNNQIQKRRSAANPTGGVE